VTTAARAVVVGAAVAGVAAAVALPDAGFDGEVVLLGEERHEPYDRPPLSKQLLRGTSRPEQLRLPGAAQLREREVELRLGTRATGLDLEQRELELEGGDRLPFDGLIVATGSVPKRLPGQPDLPGLHMLRTIDDAVALRAELVGARRVGVVGAGFIGLEVASEARALGAAVTVVDLAPHPLARVFGPEVGARVRRLHDEHGVEFRCGEAIEGLAVREGRVVGIELADGVVETDLVVVGIGTVPADAWLAGSGLRIEDGVVCDAELRAAPAVYAAGDVARWEHPIFGPIRVEHWTTAGEHARVAAHNLALDLGGAGASRRADAVPYFWSDQHGVKLQLAGWIAGSDAIAELEGEGVRSATLFGREGRLVGALALDWPAFVARQRRAIGAGTRWEDALDAAEKEAAKVGITNLQT
jgi:3-phenylpropionate/trans-cinnamate dioxygenase ferredoxin reductase subunit